MTDNTQPIRKKTLWQNVEFMEKILEATGPLVVSLPPEVRGKHEATLDEGYRALAELTEQAKRVEGPREQKES